MQRRGARNNAAGIDLNTECEIMSIPTSSKDHRARVNSLSPSLFPFSLSLSLSLESLKK